MFHVFLRRFLATDFKHLHFFSFNNVRLDDQLCQVSSQLKRDTYGTVFAVLPQNLQYCRENWDEFHGIEISRYFAVVGFYGTTTPGVGIKSHSTTTGVGINFLVLMRCE